MKFLLNAIIFKWWLGVAHGAMLMASQWKVAAAALHGAGTEDAVKMDGTGAGLPSAASQTTQVASPKVP